MPTLKAILFDLDDTLLDWSGFDGDYRALELPHFISLREFVTGAGYPLPDVDNLLHRFRERALAGWESGRETLIAPHLPQILEAVLADCGVPTGALSREAILEHYNWGKAPGTVVFPEVPATLELFRRHGLHIGIVTNAFQTMDMRDKELAQHDLLRHFDDCCRFAAADIGYLKPHPAIFEAALACTGTTPQETVFVGDNLTADVVGAQRMGMKAVWRDTGHHNSRLSIDTITPDATIRTLDEMLPILDDWYPDWRA